MNVLKKAPLFRFYQTLKQTWVLFSFAVPFLCLLISALFDKNNASVDDSNTNCMSEILKDVPLMHS